MTGQVDGTLGEDRAPSSRVIAAPLASALYVERATEVLTASGALLAVLALADLAVRAVVRLEYWWDTFWYHLPFFALRGGLRIPYEMDARMSHLYEGFPPLPHLLQGLLWRLTGEINATGVVNFLAFIAFLGYCHVALRARFWLVALIALTAPMVVIHATTSLVDLFGNSLLAIGISSCLYLFLFPKRPERLVMLCGLGGLIGAAWSKFNLVPVVAVGLCMFLAVGLRKPRKGAYSRRRAALVVVAAALLAALPYAKNLSVYGNPFWPVRVPVMVEWFPYEEDPVAAGLASQRPPPLADYSGAALFVHSLFEINHPTRYDQRPRWKVDQGNAWIAFRMGGFWWVGVGVYLAAMMIMLVVYDRKRGTIVSMVTVATLCFVAILPQSHELRYYMFIPLSWAATVGMLFPHFKKKIPLGALALLILAIGLFSYMVRENHVHYRIEKIDYLQAARDWRAEPWWEEFERGQTYCVVGMEPIGMLMTGPTMSEYSIVERSSEALCPDGAVLVDSSGVHDVVQQAGTEQ